MNTSRSRRAHKLPNPLSLKTAAWLMRLNSVERTPAVDAAFQEWLSQNPEHRKLFELGGDLWEKTASLPITRAARLGFLPSQSRRSRFLKLAAACAALAGVALLAMWTYQLRSPVLATTTGQQLALSLEDGTRVILNTETRLKVRFDEQVRRIVLESGEALFDVAQDRMRPFVVRAGGHEVIALGTQFSVRYDAKRTAILLMQGKVSVAPLESSSSVRSAAAQTAKTILQPGERVTFDRERPPQLDRPGVDKVMAWRQGHIAFEETPLKDAIEEVNRYSTRKLVLGESAISDVPISGLFRTGDSDNFALALTHAHPLKILEEDGKLIVLRAPH